MPEWLSLLAIASLALAALCALVIAIDILAGHRQHMAIMNVVWPVSALYAGPLALWAYYRVGRLSTHGAVQAARARGEEPPGSGKPFWQVAGLSASHCGAGCALGDLIAEWLVVLVPVVLFGHAIFGTWAVDYAFAFTIGIAFQYLTIQPMRGLSPGRGLVAAIQADALSLTSWQLGMYGWMAIATFAIFGSEIPKTSPVFWLMMQIAMLAGFATSFPVNWWLVRTGIKEGM